MPNVKVFWLSPTPNAEQSLRRYTPTIYLQNPDGAHVLDAAGHVQHDPARHKTCPGMPGDFSYHNASVVLGHVPMPAEYLEKGYTGGATIPFPKDDPRWPTKCERCDYAFTPDDTYQHNLHQLMSGAPDGELHTIRGAPVGAMWDAAWLRHFGEQGADGICLEVRTPGGDWHVDSEASNCTRKGDKTHKCWVRHGDPRTGNVHVDKNGDTCAAGAGSIICGSYHGFLHHGELVSC